MYNLLGCFSREPKIGASDEGLGDNTDLDKEQFLKRVRRLVIKCTNTLVSQVQFFKLGRRTRPASSSTGAGSAWGRKRISTLPPRSSSPPPRSSRPLPWSSSPPPPEQQSYSPQQSYAPEQQFSTRFALVEVRSRRGSFSTRFAIHEVCSPQGSLSMRLACYEVLSPRSLLPASARHGSKNMDKKAPGEKDPGVGWPYYLQIFLRKSCIFCAILQVMIAPRVDLGMEP